MVDFCCINWDTKFIISESVVIISRELFVKSINLLCVSVYTVGVVSREELLWLIFVRSFWTHN